MIVSSIGHCASIRLENPELAARTQPTPDLVTQLGRIGDGALRGTLAQASVSEMFVLTTLGREEQALALGKGLVDAVSDDDTPAVRRHAAMACQNLVELLNAQGRSAEAEEALRNLARFGDELLMQYEEAIAASGESDRDTQLGVRFRRADLLRAMGRIDEAVEAYASVISDFGEDPDARVVVDRARKWQAALTSGGEQHTAG